MNLHLGTNPNQLETRSLNASKTARRVPLLYLVVLLALASGFLGLPQISKIPNPNLQILTWKCDRFSDLDPQLSVSELLSMPLKPKLTLVEWMGISSPKHLSLTLTPMQTVLPQIDY